MPTLPSRTAGLEVVVGRKGGEKRKTQNKYEVQCTPEPACQARNPRRPPERLAGWHSLDPFCSVRWKSGASPIRHPTPPPSLSFPPPGGCTAKCVSVCRPWHRTAGRLAGLLQSAKWCRSSFFFLLFPFPRVVESAGTRHRYGKSYFLDLSLSPGFLARIWCWFVRRSFKKKKEKEKTSKFYLFIFNRVCLFKARVTLVARRRSLSRIQSLATLLGTRC